MSVSVFCGFFAGEGGKAFCVLAESSLEISAFTTPHPPSFHSRQMLEGFNMKGVSRIEIIDLNFPFDQLLF